MHPLDEKYVGKESDCDWCGAVIVLKPCNMLMDGTGRWVMTRCDVCSDPTQCPCLFNPDFHKEMKEAMLDG